MASPGSERPPASRPNRIRARRVDIESIDDDLVEIHKIAYFFLGRAAVNDLIDADWVDSRSGALSASSVYFRTTDGRLYRVKRMRMSALLALLGPQFERAHRTTVLVNIDRIARPEFRSRPRQVVFRIRDDDEYVRVSRRAAVEIGRRFDL